MNDDKIYFTPGDIVYINKRLSNKPSTMMVIGNENKNDSRLIGIRCLFFDNLGTPHECIFNTKDLELYIQYND